MELYQVWCVSYDAFMPDMSGTPERIRTHEWPDYSMAARAYDIFEQQRVKQNLKIETRWVSKWEVADAAEHGSV